MKSDLDLIAEDNKLIDTFVERLKKIGILVKLSANYPWIYIDKINGKRVTEKFRAEHGFTVAFFPVNRNQKAHFTDIKEIFKLIKKYIKMRPIERIPNFIEKVNWDVLEQRWDVDLPMPLRAKLNKDGSIYKYWLKDPDLRFGQLLINLQLVPDKLRIWNDEEVDILRDQGLEDREILFWGRTMDENRNSLPKIQWILIKDMSTEHINAILEDVVNNRFNVRNDYLKAFETELTLRRLLKAVNEENN